jgi:hypothetical protein
MFTLQARGDGRMSSKSERQRPAEMIPFKNLSWKCHPVVLLTSNQPVLVL